MWVSSLEIRTSNYLAAISNEQFFYPQTISRLLQVVWVQLFLSALLRLQMTTWRLSKFIFLMFAGCKSEREPGSTYRCRADPLSMVQGLISPFSLVLVSLSCPGTNPEWTMSNFEMKFLILDGFLNECPFEFYLKIESRGNEEFVSNFLFNFIFLLLKLPSWVSQV